MGMNPLDESPTYSLTPMQKGMLFQCLAAPRSGNDVEQVIGALHESLDLPAFKQAWQRLVDRHEALRMRFVLEGNGSARQFPLDQATLSIDEFDWSGRPSPEQEQVLETFLKDDRMRGFDPRAEMPIRVAVFHLDESDYRFVWTWWHGILDGRARLILLQELFRFYEAFRQGEDIDLPLPRRYTDYTGWLAARDMATAEPYWKELLQGFTEPTPVGNHALLNVHDSGDFGVHEIRLSRAVTSRLQAAVKAQGVTMNTLVQGAWALVLSRYSGEDDVVFGNTRACRRSAFDGDGSGEDIVGELINTVPVRVKMEAETRVLDWLKDLRKQHVAVRPYEHSSLIAVQACSGVPADQRLFNSIIVYENELLDSALRSQEGNWEGRRFETRGQPGFPLTAYGYGEPELLLGIFNDRACIDDATTERMLANFAMTIQSLPEHWDDVLTDLPLLPDEERQLLLEEWNRTGWPFPEESTIQRCFEEQAARTPNAPALTFRDKTWTYHELDQRAEAIARQLREAGAGPEIIIGICMERCLDLVAGMLGILKSGAAYLPLDPSYPPDRLAFMIEDARPLLVVSNQTSRGRLSAAKVPILSVDGEALPSGSADSADRREKSCGRHLAYVIYTSGSTGKPKGVMVEHRNVMNLFSGIDAVYGCEPGVCLAVTSISFDPSVVDLFWTLVRGYHVVIWPGVDGTHDLSIPELIRENGVTYIGTVPSFIRMVMMLPGGTNALALLRLIQVGGEALSTALIRELGPTVTRRIVNAYGPTETTVISTVWEVDPGAASFSIGRPIANTQIFILDRHRRPVPVGVVGELYIGGASVARGYLNRPELTAEKFVPNPFDRTASGRLYRTGDLVRYRPDGMLEFVGRIDDQVKIRGFRVELGEIETVLNKHPDLLEVVVDIQDRAEGGKRLVAYVVPGPKGMPPTKELREWVGRELPVYMVPAAFIALEEIPRTSNGKLDRRALPPPDSSDVGPGALERTPTSLEAKLIEVWCEVLGRKQVGLDENFFDLGGDSLMAVAMMVAIEERFGVKIPVEAVFEAPTVAGLAVAMAGEGMAAEVVPISPARRVTTVPASFGQEALWIHARLGPGSAVYNVPLGLRLRGALNLAALQAALDGLLERHEALRTTFTTVDDHVRQVIANRASIPLQRISVEDAPESDRLPRAEGLASEEARRPFDLERGSLIRATLVTLGPTDHMLVLVLHHSICDGRSMMILLYELGVLYSSGLAGQPASLPQLPIQYGDFAEWQREYLTESRLAPHLDFWKQQLAGTPPLLKLPTDRPRSAVQSYRGEYIPIRFDREFTERLRALSRRCGCTLFMTLMAGLQTLIARYLRPEERDVVVGFPVAGRARRETEGIVGFFVNTLVLRSDLSDNPTFRELLSRVRRTALAAYAHQELPFERLVAVLKPERTLSYAPVFQVVLALHEEVPDIPLSGLEVSIVPLHSGTAKFDLSVALDSTSEGGLTGLVEYATDLFDQRTVERMVGHLRQLLEAAAQEPDQRVEQMPLLTESERHQLLFEWNDTHVDYPQEKTVVQAFEEQVARTPDAPALTFRDKTWKYRELDQKAEGVARRLREAGARPETIVGICMERCLDLVAGMLGILKTGAAYLPLDPNYPPDRLAFMIEDAKPLLVVSNHNNSERLSVADVPILSVDGVTVPSSSNGFLDHRKESGSGRHLAYVMYTSGSTGKPKGVMVEHRNVMNLFAGIDAAYGCEPGVCLAVTGVSFDPSILDLFWMLVRGYHVVIWPGIDEAHDLSIPELIQKHGVTFIGTVPSFIRMVMMLPGGTDALALLRLIQVGGEALSTAMIEELGPTISRRIVNAYGPTETTVISTVWKVDPEAASIPIGRPIANTQIFVLDPHCCPVPVGVVGELYIGGAGVACGYLNRPDLTDEKFVPNPFGHAAGERLYRTGDLVRYRSDGMLEFIGRIDDQVKIRGFRVELGEIETVLNKHPDLLEAVVDIQDRAEGGKQLVAYCVPGPKGMPPTKVLREWVGRELPGYMVPAAFVALDEIPRTSNGKLDRRNLPAPDGHRQVEETYVAPRNATEKLIASIWCEVLGLEGVGIYDNFFDLGGNSLLATVLTSRLKAVFDVDLNLRDFFDSPSIAGIATVIEEMVLREVGDMPDDEVMKLLAEEGGNGR